MRGRPSTSTSAT